MERPSGPVLGLFGLALADGGLGAWREAGAADPFPLQPGQLPLHLLYPLNFPPRWPPHKGFHGSERFKNVSLAVCPIRSLAQRRCSVIVCCLPFVCLPVLRANEGEGAGSGRRALILSCRSGAETDGQGLEAGLQTRAGVCCAHRQCWREWVGVRVYAHVSCLCAFVCSVCTSLCICVVWSSVSVYMHISVCLCMGISVLCVYASVCVCECVLHLRPAQGVRTQPRLASL